MTTGLMQRVAAAAAADGKGLGKGSPGADVARSLRKAAEKGVARSEELLGAFPACVMCVRNLTRMVLQSS